MDWFHQVKGQNRVSSVFPHWKSTTIMKKRKSTSFFQNFLKIKKEKSNISIYPNKTSFRPIEEVEQDR